MQFHQKFCHLTASPQTLRKEKPSHKGAIYFNYLPYHLRRDPTKTFNNEFTKWLQERSFIQIKKILHLTKHIFLIFIYFDHCIVLEEFVKIIVFLTTSPNFSETGRTISYLSLLKVHVVVNTNFLLLNCRQTDQTLVTTKRH